MLPSPDPSALQAFLAHPSRPADTLRYHELQGFLFAVASGPELVLPSEWQPIIFGDQDAEFASLDEAKEILGQITALLWLTLILIPLVILFWCVLGAMALVLPIVGAVKASQGDYYQYPVVGLPPG